MNYTDIDVALEFFHASERGIVIQHSYMSDRNRLLGYIISKLTAERHKAHAYSIHNIKVGNKRIHFTVIGTGDSHNKLRGIKQHDMFFVEREEGENLERMPHKIQWYEAPDDWSDVF